MSRSVLVAYATKKGSVAEVAESIGATLRGQGLTADVRPAATVKSVDGYDTVVLGGALYMGRWHADAKRFLKRHHEALGQIPFAAFGMGPLTMAEKDVTSARKQLDRALHAERDVTPFSVAIFGGVVDPAKLHFPFNRMPASDARDWDAIREWAESLPAKLGQVGLARVGD
jgi:menaquinone-dependent protoporphyrinogen oxidase